MTADYSYPISLLESVRRAKIYRQNIEPVRLVGKILIPMCLSIGYSVVKELFFMVDVAGG